MDQERRRHQRFETQNVHGSLLFRTRVEVVNISLTGIAVESPERLDRNRTYRLSIRHDEETLDVVAKVVWCRLARTVSEEDEVAPVYRAGLEFEQVLQESAKGIRSFIEHNAVLTLDQRIFGRFEFRMEGAVDVDTHYDFLVRSLSLSGMRIETEIMPDTDSIFDMQIDFPESSIFLKGRVVHSRPVNNFEGKHPRTQVGIEFSELEERSRDILAGYIREESRRL